VKLIVKKEGQVEFYIPDPSEYQSIYSAPVFYNPAMEKNRTISILLLRELGSGLTVCEPLSGTGVRGIRYVIESKAVDKLILNDISKTAVEIIKKNLNLNGVDAEVYNEDANVLLHRLKGVCDVVDIDPFGSPAPFIHAAFKALREEAVLCVTATDTAVLVGRYSRKCLRRYGSTVKKTPFYIEIGLRNLVGYLARVAASEDFYIEPLFSYWEAHYFRICLRVIKGARNADDVFNFLKYVEYRRGFRKIVDVLNEASSGPLWVGPLGEPAIVHKMTRGGVYTDFLNLLEIEYAVDAPWYYRTFEFAKGGKGPTLREVLKYTKEAGIYATPTHMARDGFKTEASYGELVKTLYFY
jgi:tRNA (guanine26-N2/guanine27-N2)-dimethyltransferase